jgi:hypothetical protein
MATTAFLLKLYVLYTKNTALVSFASDIRKDIPPGDEEAQRKWMLLHAKDAFVSLLKTKRPGISKSMIKRAWSEVLTILFGVPFYSISKQAAETGEAAVKENKKGRKKKRAHRKKLQYAGTKTAVLSK